ncbi:DUF7269 family protein [Halorarum halobium]|uniref:DUF7269 family protein n=1 Tax=Halorarum halobium TaxID=3075121 RepID=UPI0028AC2A7F|nr:hypothetical protein [Halobaculum sp. XH14]
MRRSAALGLVAVVFGFTVVLQRGLAAPFGSMSYLFVTGVGAFALVQGLRYASAARDVDDRATETADVEDRYEVPSPGREIDEHLAGADGLSVGSIKRRRELHDRFRRVTRETLRARGDYDEASVAAAVEGGTWTDDPVAAWFLGSDVSPPPSVRIRRVLGSDVEFTFAARRTVEALADARTGSVEPDRREPPEPPESGDVRGLVRAVGRRLRRVVPEGEMGRSNR